MYHLSFYENGRFISFIGGEIPTLPSAIENLNHMKSIIDNPQVVSNTSVKYDRNGTTCAIVITDRWNQPIYEAKFQENDANASKETEIKELETNE